jgi:RNA polymerase sigma-70 factor (ECF subfamily)
MDSLQEGQADSVQSRDPEPSAVAAGNETYGMVLEAVSTLPENQQEAFRLKFQDEMTYREISQVMGISLGMVSRLVAAALSDLREQLRGKINLVQEV